MVSFSGKDVPFDVGLDLAARQQRIEKFEQQPTTSSGVYSLTLAFAAGRFQEIRQILQKEVLPAFFRRYPQGKFLALKLAYEANTRQATVRGGYTAAQYGRLDRLQTSSDAFNAMWHWQPLDPAKQLHNILDLGAIVFFPTIQYFVASRPGLIGIFVPDKLVQHTILEFPPTWMDVFRSHWDFGREGGVTNIPADGITQSYNVLRQFLQNPGFDPENIERWVTRLIERANVLQFHQTDPAEFVKDDLVDFVSCFEHALSADRMGRKGISAIASSETMLRKSAAMEIGDIIEELANHWRSRSGGASNRFKTLFHPLKGLALITEALRDVPEPLKTHLLGAAASIYQDVQATIVNSVFVPAKRTATGGVLVRNRALAAEAEENAADFTANVIRCLRNTNHGYMTNGDRQFRPSRYLALITGEIPDTFSYLGALFALGYIADPEVMTGWKMMELAHWE